MIVLDESLKISQDESKDERLSKTLVDLLRKSFLSSLLVQDITDISFNGETLYINDNIKGRSKISDVAITTKKVLDLIRQIANLMGKNFNYTHPILEVAFDKYRLSAIYSSIAKSKSNTVITFSLRIRHERLRITENDFSLCPKQVYDLLNKLINSEISLLISGKTGSGKTELQKYLVSKIDPFMKIIIIEDNYESCLKELLVNHDITTWITNEQYTLSKLVKVALRNQPDWLIVAETRGEEVIDMIESVSTGHPLITTLHAQSAIDIFNRIYHMGQKHIKLNKDDFDIMLNSYFKIGIHMEATITSRGIKRYIKHIIEYVIKGRKVVANVIFENYEREIVFTDISTNLAKKLSIDCKWY